MKPSTKSRTSLPTRTLQASRVSPTEDQLVGANNQIWPKVAHKEQDWPKGANKEQDWPKGANEDQDWLDPEDDMNGEDSARTLRMI